MCYITTYYLKCTAKNCCRGTKTINHFITDKCPAYESWLALNKYSDPLPVGVVWNPSHCTWFKKNSEKEREETCAHCWKGQLLRIQEFTDEGELPSHGEYDSGPVESVDVDAGTSQPECYDDHDSNIGDFRVN